MPDLTEKQTFSDQEALDFHRIPTPGNGRTTTPRFSISGKTTSVCDPSGRYTKLVWASGRSQPSARRAATTRSRSTVIRSTTACTSSRAAIAASEATWARWFTAKAIRTLSSSTTTSGSATA